MMDRTPKQALNLGVGKNVITEEQDDANLMDDIKPLNPIAKIYNLGERIFDMKWILNDTFLLVLTESGNYVIFDSLLYAFNLCPSHS